MKRVVSVSLGSSSRDHRFETIVLGQPISIERIGTDGDTKRAKELLEELDGKVDALGLGGTDLYLRAGDRKYLIRQTATLVKNIRKTPFVDGGGLKASWERWLITDYLPKEKGISFRGRRVVLVWDGLPAHRSRTVRAYLARERRWLMVEPLPGYAPELNPDELVWNYMKRTGTAKQPLRKGDQMQARIDADLQAIQRNPKLVRSFFRAPSVAYISDC